MLRILERVAQKRLTIFQRYPEINREKIHEEEALLIATRGRIRQLEDQMLCLEFDV